MPKYHITQSEISIVVYGPTKDSQGYGYSVQIARCCGSHVVTDDLKPRAVSTWYPNGYTAYAKNPIPENYVHGVFRSYGQGIDFCHGEVISELPPYLTNNIIYLPGKRPFSVLTLNNPLTVEQVSEPLSGPLKLKMRSSDLPHATIQGLYLTYFDSLPDVDCDAFVTIHTPTQEGCGQLEYVEKRCEVLYRFVNVVNINYNEPRLTLTFWKKKS